MNATKHKALVEIIKGVRRNDLILGKRTLTASTRTGVDRQIERLKSRQLYYSTIAEWTEVPGQPRPTHDQRLSRSGEQH